MTDTNLDQTTAQPPQHGGRASFLLAGAVMVVALAAGLVAVHNEHFLLYHTLVELVGISLIWSVFLLLWSARAHLNQQAFVVLGTGTFAASLLALYHTLAFKGLNIVGQTGESDQPTQLWMAARFMECAAFLAFPLWLNRRVRGLAFLVIFLATALILGLSILQWGWFPSCHDPDSGLSTFKIAGEALVVIVTIVAAGLLFRQRQSLDPVVHGMLQVMLMASVLAEITFTTYSDVTGNSVAVGHVFRVLSSFSLFLAIVQITVKRPQAMLFQQLQLKQDERSAHARISHFALGSDIRSVLQRVLDEAEALTGSTIGFFHFVDTDQEHLELQAWSSHTLSDMCTAEGSGLHYAVSDAGVWADCIRRREPVVHNDYASLPQRKGMPAGHAEVIREVVVPVIREEKVVAVLGVGNKVAPYNRGDVRLITELADLAWDVVLRKRAELALAESERRLVRTMANLPGMVYRCRNDEQWTMEFVSQGCLDLTGYEVDELERNRLVSYNDLILPGDRKLVRDKVELGLSQRDTFQLVYRIRKRDGQEIWVWEQGRGVYLDGELQALEGFIYDVSVQIEAQDERQRLERKILEAQKLESLGVLAGGIAHDFNNLLQAILGNTQLALMELGDTAPQQEYLQQVLTASRRAADLTGQMLAYSGHASFVTEAVDVTTLVEELVALMRSSIPSSTELRCDLTRDGAVIDGGSAQIQQVVLNLVTNAAEAIDGENGTVTITTDICQCTADDLAAGVEALYPAGDGPEPGPFVRLTVHDTGPGMDETTQARLFDPFFTTKFAGRGLGLAAVLGILRSHGGTLHLATEPGSTTFEVLLPQHRDVMGATQSVPGATMDTATSQLDRLRFLVVDDEAAVRAFLGHVIRREGGEVIPAGDGLEALEILDGRQPLPDAVLLDLTMPRLGGQRCYQEIRERHPHLPVLLMSGYSADELRRRFPDDGSTDYLSKPFEQQAIVAALRSLLAARTGD